MARFRLAVFRADVTPPIGHPLCGGWVRPAVAVEDPLFALGVVLLGEEAPVVLCAVDWCEISNEDHVLWRQVLAAAAGTTPDRVAVQCVHQHDAPWPDREAQRLLVRATGLPLMMDEAWCDQAAARVADAVRRALPEARPVTHLTTGEAEVERVASNRRLYGPGGKVRAVRYSTCRDPELRAEPEGLIDPMLKTVAFWDGEEPLAALHYYAVHPMSHYGEGRVSADFAGHARDRRTAEAGVPHLYFTGCAGNLAAGKYNDGAPENRPVLAERLYRAMVASEERGERVEAGRLVWRSRDIPFPPDLRRSEAEWEAALNDPAERQVERCRAALRIVRIRRHAAGRGISLSSLALGDRIRLLHLPGEPFVEYQLLAQDLAPGCFVAVAGYGDCAPGYLPLARSYEEGGYEPTDSFVSPACEALLRAAIADLLRAH